MSNDFWRCSITSVKVFNPQNSKKKLQIQFQNESEGIKQDFCCCCNKIAVPKDIVKDYFCFQEVFLRTRLNISYWTVKMIFNVTRDIPANEWPAMFGGGGGVHQF